MIPPWYDKERTPSGASTCILTHVWGGGGGIICKEFLSTKICANSVHNTSRYILDRKNCGKKSGGSTGHCLERPCLCKGRANHLPSSLQHSQKIASI